ncbi:MAG: CGNR zinc finger domain-containing protein [Mycobacterium sp.]
MSPTSTSPQLEDALPILLTNTVSIDRGRIDDIFADRSGVRQWVSTIGKQIDLWPRPSNGQPITDDEAERLISLRDGIRRLAAEHTSDPRALGQSPVRDVAAAMTIVNTSSALGWVWPEMQWHGSTALRRDVWTGGTYADALTTLIARQSTDLITSPQWDRLRPCLAPGCAYFFLKDHLRREWCSPPCGNRARVARHAQRHRND